MIHYQVQVWLQGWQFVETMNLGMGHIHFNSNERLSKAKAIERHSALAALHSRYQFRVVAVDENFNLL